MGRGWAVLGGAARNTNKAIERWMPGVSNLTGLKNPRTAYNPFPGEGISVNEERSCARAARAGGCGEGSGAGL
jgi:hypothetical protein